MSDYSLYKPLIDRVSTAVQNTNKRLPQDCSLSFYINNLKFYGESGAEDKVVYTLLYLNSKNINNIRRLFNQERNYNPAFKFCKNVLNCIAGFSNPFDEENTFEKLHKSFFDKTDEFIDQINISDSKRYIKFIVELLWLLLQIRTNFIYRKIVERILISPV